jgi:transcriptional regulator with XRE-family HTH domain
MFLKARRIPDVARSPRYTSKKLLELAQALEWSDSELARALGVERQTVRSYRDPAKTANPTADKLVSLIKRIRDEGEFRVDEIEDWLSKPEYSPLPPLVKISNSPHVKRQSVGDNKDKVLPGRQSDTETKRAMSGRAGTEKAIAWVQVGNGAHIWSGNGAQRVDVTVFEYVLSGDRVLVKVEDDSLGSAHRGSTLAFKPSREPLRGPFLLCAKRVDPDLMTIRYISPSGRGDALLSPDPEIHPEPLSAWDVIGFADHELFPADGDEPDVFHRPKGIGPL